jgi:uncharacterized protein (TIGR03083 family)
MPGTPDVWIDVRQEREALLALLESLAPAEWEEPSLCTEWRVRDVVGHMVSETMMTILKVMQGLVTSGLRINRFIAIDARRQGSVPIAELVAGFRDAVPSRAHLPGLSSISMLEDIVVHSLDIRRPLLHERAVPEARMILVAADLLANRFFLGHKLFRGLQVRAIDADWSAGEGPEVTGPIEGLVLAMSGRLVGLDELHGEGMSAVYERASLR